LDQIGIFSRSVEDNATILSVIAGHDVKDSTTLMVEKKDYTAHLTGKLKDGLKIGIIENALNAEGVDESVQSAIETAIKEFEKLGATVKRISVPAMDFSAATYFIVSRAEAASNLARFDGVRYGFRAPKYSSLSDMYQTTRHDGFGKEVQARIMVGNYVLSAGHAGQFYNNAQKVQQRMRHEIHNAFREVDILLSPTTPASAFKIGAFTENKLQLDLQDYFTCIANLTGIPAFSMPCGFSKENLPISFQIMAPHLHEGLLYQTAHVYEKNTSWHTMHPKGYE
jgi:aspartyl-tRNA(Asn)/glutamyl-tRNA(Gln) amidotransferase subunit A